MQADRPLAAAAVGLLFASLVVSAGLARAGGDVSLFVRAAPPWTDPSALPAGVHVAAAPYDGEFYYRLALDPFTDRRTAHGITLDLPAYRQQRALYPLLAWAVALGDPSRIAVALVVVNVAALIAVAWLGGRLARSSGRHALWGSLFTLYPGFAITVVNDLTELVAAAFLLAALSLLRAARPVPAAGALALAALARETTLLVPATAIVTGAARSRRFGGWLALGIPLLIALAWQVLLAVRWSATSVLQGASALGPPLLGLLAAAWSNAERYGPSSALIWSAVVAFAFALAIVGLLAVGRPARPHERAAWWAYAALATALEANIWANAAILRALTELAMLSALLVLGTSPRLRWALLGMEIALSAVLIATGSPL